MVESGESRPQPDQKKVDTGSQGEDSSGEKTSLANPKSPFEKKEEISSPKKVDQSQEKTPLPQNQSTETSLQNTSLSQSGTQYSSEGEIVGGFVFTNPIASPVRLPRARRPYRFRKKQ